MKRGLKPLIYHLLLEKPQTGYSIAKTIEERTGWKPSWGSIYPALENLHEKGYVDIKETGRSKTYTLTKEGKKQAEKTSATREQAFEKMIEQLRILHELGEEGLEEQIALLQQLKNPSNNPFGTIQKDAERLQEQMLRLWKNDLLNKHKKDIKATLQHATKQLKQLT